MPTRATLEDLRQMVDGQLCDRGKDPRNVQVLICWTQDQKEGEVDSLETLKLRDEQGDFLEATVEPSRPVKSESGESSEEEEPLHSGEELGDLCGRQETSHPQYPSSQVQEETSGLQEQLEALSSELQSKTETVMALKKDLEDERSRTEVLGEEVRSLNDMIRCERERMKHVWSLNCEQLRLLDDECGRCVVECGKKDTEIELLRKRVRELETHTQSHANTHTTHKGSVSETRVLPVSSRGPPVPAPIPTPVMPVARDVPVTQETPVISASLPGRINFSGTVCGPERKVCPSEAAVSSSTEHPVATPTPRRDVGRNSEVVVTGTSHNRLNVRSSEFESSNEGPVQPVRKRLGKAPPVDSFNGEQPEVRFEDWLPTLERAAAWNGWSNEELLLQLAGHLRGKALQEWSLMGQAEKARYKDATVELTRRLDPGSRIMAVQDFRHAVQRETESVADYLRRLERHFQLAYGKDDLRSETKETMLYSQLQEGLLLSLVRSPSVSGCQTYKELCVAAKQEEKRLADLRRRQHYQQGTKGSQSKTHEVKGRYNQSQPRDKQAAGSKVPTDGKRQPNKIRTCYNCGSADHFMKDCKVPSTESGKRTDTVQSSGAKKLKMVQTTKESLDDPLLYLESSDSDGDGQVSVVRVPFEGSDPRQALVGVQGIPARGVIDTGSDITIIGSELFKTVAAATHMKKRCLKPVDKAAFTYDNKPIRLDGRLDLEISFEGKVVHTPVYIKMDSSDQLLLSEGVCRQLGVVSYHPSVIAKKKGRTPETPPVRVPTIRVKLVKSVRVPPLKCVTAQVRLEGEDSLEGPILIESSPDREVHLADAMVSSIEGKEAVCVVIHNPTGFTQHFEQGTQVGQACEADPVGEDELDELVDAPKDLSPVVVRQITDVESRQKKLASFLVDEGQSLNWQDRDRLYTLLFDHHTVFALDGSECGETDLVQMEILTGDAPPKRQPVRRTPFAVRGEVARQLREMQENDVISPSSSPWASPVVLVRKKDGTLRFCIDYRELNSVTKADTFPLPRIDDLLDQLNRAKYFSTLDLAAGYWQVQVHPQSREKTAFVTHQGLYQFNVMPFGLRNAPAVFQRLMQRVLAGLNPEDGVPFNSVYIDDILVFSETFEDHLVHLKAVIERISAAGLKLKPSKCKFIRQTVEFLGHVLTPMGIRPNPDRVGAVQNFPRPKSVREVRQFLGLASYYRRFVKGFATLAQPLHSLTKANSRFNWTIDCQSAFDALKTMLLMSPVLSFPDFSRGFILETDASVKGLGAVLSQKGEDGKIHPVAYASRALSPQEQRYSVTELETLAVVWAVKHYLAYLYGHDVLVYTDHSAVRAVLNSPHPNGKHARWWSLVHGSGIRNLEIKYRAGRENSNADALSRNPVMKAAPEPEMVTDVQVAAVECQDLLVEGPAMDGGCVSDLADQQMADPDCGPLLNFLMHEKLPENAVEAKKIAAQAPLFDVVEGILCFVGPKTGGPGRKVVPRQLRQSLVESYHSGEMSGHFSGPKLLKAIARHWWWQGMYRDVTEHCSSCPQCTVVNASGRVHQPLLQPIPVQRPFQIVGVDVMELPVTRKGNKYVVVFQDFLTKWPFVFPVPDQKASRLVKLLVEEVVPVVGVPESLLSDRGTNLLSHLMNDVCKLLGIQKINTTAYHPACDGLVERFNRTLKTALRKHAAVCGDQWDKYLSGVIWAYRNVPHDSTGEKPSFLLFGTDLRSPTEAAMLPATPLTLTDVEDYREELVFSLSSARECAVESIRAAQGRYKKYHDRHATPYKYRVGGWVFIRFPQLETGRQRKLSRPWHGPYRVVSVQNPDICAVKAYFPDEGQIRVHQSRVKPCPVGFPAGAYLYKGRMSLGTVPRWVQQYLSDCSEVTEDLVSEESSSAGLGRDNEVLPEVAATAGELSDETPPLIDESMDSTSDEPLGSTTVELTDSITDESMDSATVVSTDLSTPESMDSRIGESCTEDPGVAQKSRTCTRYRLRQAVKPPVRLYAVNAVTNRDVWSQGRR